MSVHGDLNLLLLHGEGDHTIASFNDLLVLEFSTDV